MVFGLTVSIISIVHSPLPMPFVVMASAPPPSSPSRKRPVVAELGPKTPKIAEARRGRSIFGEVARVEGLTPGIVKRVFEGVWAKAAAQAKQHGSYQLAEMIKLKVFMDASNHKRKTVKAIPTKKLRYLILHGPPPA